jgi:voltage-dependent potassium channel beta subunit
MLYNRLGSAGIKVSQLSFGSWVTFSTQLDDSRAAELLKQAYDAGVNFLDNAEAYAGGAAETIMGRALKKLGLRRSSYLVSSKFYWGLHEGPNEKNTLNRKYLMQAIDGSLQRFGLEYLDLVFCHRPDPNTPIEETVRAMSDMVTQGKALYWGTSEWSAEQIMQAWSIADRHNLHKPQMEQPQYNLFTREKVDREFSRLYREIGLGLTTWSPLASGLLTGKYNAGVPIGSRAGLSGYEWLKEKVIIPQRVEAVKRLVPIAGDLGCTVGQLSIAWCLKNPNVSTVILGATSGDQLAENLLSASVVEKLDEGVMKEIEAAVGSLL